MAYLYPADLESLSGLMDTLKALACATHRIEDDLDFVRRQKIKLEKNFADFTCPESSTTYREKEAAKKEFEIVSYKLAEIERELNNAREEIIKRKRRLSAIFDELAGNLPNWKINELRKGRIKQ